MADSPVDAGDVRSRLTRVSGSRGAAGFWFWFLRLRCFTVDLSLVFFGSGFLSRVVGRVFGFHIREGKGFPQTGRGDAEFPQEIQRKQQAQAAQVTAPAHRSPALEIQRTK